MAVVSRDVIFFVVLLVLGMLWLTISTSAFNMCFYSFQTMKKDWKNSENYCQQKSGNLVSMETEEEYQLINKTIQSLNVGNNEWYIGLTKKTGDWEWISGHNMTIDKWRPPHQPNREHSDKCVKMIKDYRSHRGLFDNVDCRIHIYSICEYQKVSLELKKEIEKEKIVFYHTCYDGNDAVNDVHTSSIVPTSNTGKQDSTTEGIRTTNGNVVQQTKYTIRSASTVPTRSTTTSKASIKEQPFPIMDVVIVLAVLLAVCICTYVAVFCWFRKKSEKGQKETESSRNLPKRTPATRSVPQNQSDHNNVRSGGMKILDGNTVQYSVPDDDKDFPRFTTPNKTHEEDLSTYAEVHDAILPSAKVPSKYYDDIYLNPVDTVPTSSAQVYESVELKPLQKIETRCEKEHQQLEKNVDGRSSKEEQCLKVGAVDPADCNSLYATTDLSESNKAFGKTSIKHDALQEIKRGAINERRTTASKEANGEQTSCNSLYATTDLSKPKIVIKPSKQGQEQKRRRDGARAQPDCCDNLYATTALDAIAYKDELRRTQSFSVSSVPSYSNNPYASSGLDLKDKFKEKGLEQDDSKEKPRDGKTEKRDNAKTKCRRPSIDSIMIASRKTKDKPSIPTPYKGETGDTMMYAMVDLLNNEKEVRPVYAQVKKKHKK